MNGGIGTNELFTWLLQSGGLLLILSWVVERWPWYQAQSPEIKKVLFTGGVVLLGSGVHAMQLYVPASVWTAIDPWFQYVSGLVVLAGGISLYHKETKPSAE